MAENNGTPEPQVETTSFSARTCSKKWRNPAATSTDASTAGADNLPEGHTARCKTWAECGCTLLA